MWWYVQVGVNAIKQEEQQCKITAFHSITHGFTGVRQQKSDLMTMAAFVF